MELPKRLKRRLQKVADDLRETADQSQFSSPDDLAQAEEIKSFADLIEVELRKIPRIRSLESVVAGLQEGATA